MIAQQLALFDQPASAARTPAPRPSIADLEADHERLMARRAANIRAAIAKDYPAFAQADAERDLAAQLARGKHEMPSQDAAMFWQMQWERLRGRTNAWCVMCDQRSGCPVLIAMLDEVLRDERPAPPVAIVKGGMTG